MKMSEYQQLARRTQNPDLSPRDMIEHALWGLSAEVGEVCGLHQKKHQGHPMNFVALRAEIGDCMWFIAELCDAYDFSMAAIAEENIAKLKRRYPAGFEAEKSVHRVE